MRGKSRKSMRATVIVAFSLACMLHLGERKRLPVPFGRETEKAVHARIKKILNKLTI
jgi:hypothetical protein